MIRILDFFVGFCVKKKKIFCIKCLIILEDVIVLWRSYKFVFGIEIFLLFLLVFG